MFFQLKIITREDWFKTRLGYFDQQYHGSHIQQLYLYFGVAKSADFWSGEIEKKTSPTKFSIFSGTHLEMTAGFQTYGFPFLLITSGVTFLCSSKAELSDILCEPQANCSFTCKNVPGQSSDVTIDLSRIDNTNGEPR